MRRNNDLGSTEGLHYFYISMSVDIGLRQVNFDAAEEANTFPAFKVFGDDLFFVATKDGYRFKCFVGKRFGGWQRIPILVHVFTPFVPLLPVSSPRTEDHK